MKKRYEFEMFDLMDILVSKLREHDYSTSIIYSGKVEELKEKIYGKPIG